jgi:hypothetical protein
LYAMNQDVRTTDAVTFAQLTINGAVAFINAAEVQSFHFDADTVLQQSQQQVYHKT